MGSESPLVLSVILDGFSAGTDRFTMKLQSGKTQQATNTASPALRFEQVTREQVLL